MLISRLTIIGASLIILGLTYLSVYQSPWTDAVDVSNYMTAAKTLEDGGTLYVDTVDRKPPLLYWTFQGLGKIAGFWNLNFVITFFVFITFILALLVGWISNDWRASLFYCFMFGAFPKGILSPNAEWLMMVPVITSCVMMQKSRWWLAGICSAIAIFYKQYSILITGLAFVGWWFSSEQKIKSLGQFIMPHFILTGIITLGFYLKGAFQEFMQFFLWDGIQFIQGSQKVENHSTSLLLALLGIMASWPLLWMGIVKALPLFKNKNDFPWILAFVGATITAFLSGRYYTHYFIPMIWFGALIAFRGLLPYWPRRNFWLLLIIPWTLYLGWHHLKKPPVFSEEKISSMQSLATWIQTQTVPTQKIVIWGQASHLYLMSERGSGTRYPFSDYVSGRQPGKASEVSIPLPGAIENFMKDLEVNKPLFIVDTSTAALNDYQYFPIAKFPYLEEFVRMRYEDLGTLSGFKIFKLKNKI